MAEREMIRPTQVTRSSYILFGNKIREEGRDISEVLDNLILLYNQKGDSCFSCLEK